MGIAADAVPKCSQVGAESVRGGLFPESWRRWPGRGRDASMVEGVFGFGLRRAGGDSLGGRCGRRPQGQE